MIDTTVGTPVREGGSKAGVASHWRVWTTIGSVVVALAVWQLFAHVAFPRGDTLPEPTAVLQALWQDRQSWWPNIVATISAALAGLAIGTVIASALAALTVLVPFTRQTVLRVAVAFYSLPLVAVGPILQVRFSDRTASVVLATLSVVFITLVTTANGLRSVPPGSEAITRGFGGTGGRFFCKVRIMSALPAAVTALKVAFPGSVIGALIGEFLGAPHGLGQLLISYLSQFQTASTWATAVVITIVTTAGYAIIGVAARPILRHIPPVQATATPSLSGWSRRFGASFGAATVTGGLMLGAWVAYLRLFNISGFVGKSPREVWRYLSSGAQTGRLEVSHGLMRTLTDSGVGLASGWLAAIVVACGFVLLPPLERVLMPLVLGLRSVPIVAILPVLTLLFGRNLFGTTIIVSVIVFVPSVVLVLYGLRSVPADIVALTTAYAGSPLFVLRKVRLPLALPSIFAALRIGCPLAFIGALLAEWLATGKGLGYLMLSATTQSKYAELWAATVIMTIVAVLAYALTDSLERSAIARFQTA